jgi:phosphoserine phosphatase
MKTIYSEIKKGFLINNASKDNIIRKYNSTKFIIMDFDGTLLDGYALSIIGFKSVTNGIKKLDLKNIIILFKAIKLAIKLKNISIEQASTEFAKIIKGLKEEDFLKYSKQLYAHIFPRAICLIKKLKKNKKDLFIISLSDKKLIEKTLFNLGINNFGARELAKKDGVYLGRFTNKMNNAKNLKLSMINKKIKSKKFIFFGNELDDELIFKKAYLKIGINPNKELIKKISFDIISNGKDPWKNIVLFFNER